jgi:hypothetical protein
VGGREEKGRGKGKGREGKGREGKKEGMEEGRERKRNKGKEGRKERWRKEGKERWGEFEPQTPPTTSHTISLAVASLSQLLRPNFGDILVSLLLYLKFKAIRTSEASTFRICPEPRSFLPPLQSVSTLWQATIFFGLND